MSNPSNIQSKKLKEFVKRNESLFWYIHHDDLDNVSLALITEIILNYGDINKVKELFDIVGIKNVSKTFFTSINKKRHNYFPDVTNYFSLYFNKYA